MIRGIRIRNIRREAEMIRGTWDRKFTSRAYTTSASKKVPRELRFKQQLTFYQPFLEKKGETSLPFSSSLPHFPKMFREKKDSKQATCDSSFFVFPEKA